MDWKQNKVVGAIAFVLMLGAFAAILIFGKIQAGRGRVQYFLCSSTGKVFSVRVDPTNQQYVDRYVVHEGDPVVCDICGQKDAYQAYKHQSGPWVKMGRAYFLCESTGKTFDVPAGPESEGYDQEYAKGPGQACLCKVCGKQDAYEAKLDGKGNWIKRAASEAEAPPEPPYDASADEVTGIEAILAGRGAQEASRQQEEQAGEPEASEESAAPPPSEDSTATAPEDSTP